MNSIHSTARSAKPSPKHPTSLEEALALLGTDRFKYLVNPDHRLMWEIIKTSPESVLSMPQATVPMQIAAVRRTGALLLAPIDWQFDTEQVFPGSTQWAKLTGPKLRNKHVGTRYDAVAVLRAVQASWTPIAELSVLAQRGLKPSTRDLLRDKDSETAATFVRLLLRAGSDSLSAMFMAVFGDCANDDVMVIKA